MDKPILTNKEKLSSVFVVSDLHYPFVEDKALYKFEEYLQTEKPDKLIIAGDALDFMEISKFPHLPGRTIKEEMAGLRDILKEWISLSPTTKIIYIEGNHTFRLRQFLIKQAPQLYDLLTFSEIMKLDELGVEYHPVREGVSKFVDNYIEVWVNDRKYFVGHFDRALKGAGNTARAIARDRGDGNYIQSHCHRAGHIVERNLEGEIFHLVESGCLCKLQANYTSEVSWCNAFVIIDTQPHLIIL